MRKLLYYARSIRTWSHGFVGDDKLPQSRQGKHIKSRSFLQDEDVVMVLQRYLRLNKFKVRIPALTSRIYEQILPQLPYAPSPTISESTTKRWLQALDITYRDIAKKIYIDGHEREDVVEYQEEFLERMAELEPRIPAVGGAEDAIRSISS